MSSEVEVLEGGISKEAVFGGQERGDQGGDDVRVIREVTRPDKTGRPEDVDLPRASFRICNLQSLPLHRLHPSTPSTSESQRLNAQSTSTSSQAYVKQSSTRYTDQVTNKIK